MAEHFDFLILNASERLRGQVRGLYGLRVAAADSAATDPLPAGMDYVLVRGTGRKRLKDVLKQVHSQSRRALLEAASGQEAALAGELGFDGVVAESLIESPVPVWGIGNIGLHSAAAWYAGGAAGVILDCEGSSWNQLAQKFRTLPAMVNGLRRSIRQHVEIAKKYARLEPVTTPDPDSRVIEGLSDVAIDELPEAANLKITFSGISGGRSAAMVAVLVAPLVEKGARISILADAVTADEGSRLVGELDIPFANRRAEEVLPPPNRLM